MLREIFVLVSFLIVLSGIVASILIVQRTTQKQVIEVERIMEIANEID